MITNNVYQAIAELDLEPIKKKLMHLAAGEGWSAGRAEAVASEYRRFMYILHAYPNEQAAPTVDVDTFWHYHILDTMKYAADCEKAFGYFMHHYPYLGLMDEDEEGVEEKAANRTRELYEATFGEQYPVAGAAPEMQHRGPAGELEPSAHTERENCKAARCTYCIVAKPTREVARCTYCIVARPTAEKSSAARCTYCITARPSVGNACNARQAGATAANNRLS